MLVEIIQWLLRRLHDVGASLALPPGAQWFWRGNGYVRVEHRGFSAHVMFSEPHRWCVAVCQGQDPVAGWQERSLPSAFRNLGRVLRSA